uniref:Uncharacterized protein n=1 Tax=Ciona savignyi TaxID=51511 RepID=H2Z5K1_CIOSA
MWNRGRVLSLQHCPSCEHRKSNTTNSHRRLASCKHGFVIVIVASPPSSNRRKTLNRSARKWRLSTTTHARSWRPRLNLWLLPEQDSNRWFSTSSAAPRKASPPNQRISLISGCNSVLPFTRLGPKSCARTSKNRSRRTIAWWMSFDQPRSFG